MEATRVARKFVSPTAGRLGEVREKINRVAGNTSPCKHCGSPDTTEIADQFLCADCIALAGCGCAGDE